MFKDKRKKTKLLKNIIFLKDIKYKLSQVLKKKDKQAT